MLFRCGLPFDHLLPLYLLIKFNLFQSSPHTPHRLHKVRRANGVAPEPDDLRCRTSPESGVQTGDLSLRTLLSSRLFGASEVLRFPFVGLASRCLTARNPHLFCTPLTPHRIYHTKWCSDRRIRYRAFEDAICSAPNSPETACLFTDLPRLSLAFNFFSRQILFSPTEFLALREYD